ncbi:hypothetical protein GCM10018953_33780 [Streptosporangium nondiastaticum]
MGGGLLGVGDGRDAAGSEHPETVVAEYELAGTVTTTGLRGAASFVAVLTVRGGKVVRWREYRNTAAIAAATGTLPALLAACGDAPAAGVRLRGAPPGPPG